MTTNERLTQMEMDIRSVETIIESMIEPGQPQEVIHSMGQNALEYTEKIMESTEVLARNLGFIKSYLKVDGYIDTETDTYSDLVDFLNRNIKAAKEIRKSMEGNLE